MYDVRFDKEAYRHLERLPVALSRRILEKIDAARERPEHFFLRLVGREDYRLRVGPYRVFADIDMHERQIAIRAIKHRREAYD